PPPKPHSLNRERITGFPITEHPLSASLFKECSMLRSSRRQALTLIELLVVFAVMVILIALLMVAVQKVRGAADRVSGVKNLHQMGVALHHHHAIQKRFPSESGSNPSLYASVLPYMEENN